MQVLCHISITLEFFNQFYLNKYLCLIFYFKITTIILTSLPTGHIYLFKIISTG